MLHQIFFVARKLGRSSPYRAAFALLLSIVERGFGALVPILFSLIVAEWEDGAPNIIVFALFAYCGSTAIAVALSEFKLLHFLPSLQAEQQKMVLDAVNELHLGAGNFKASESTPEVTRLINRASWSLDNFCNIGLFNLFPSLIQFVLALLLLALLQNVTISIILAVTMAAYLVFTMRSIRKQKTLYAKRIEHDGIIFADIGDSFLNHETVSSYDGVTEEIRRLRGGYAKLLEAWRKQQQQLSSSKWVQSLIIQAGLLLVLGTLYLMPAKHPVSVADLVMVNMYVIQVFLPLQSIGLLLASFAQALTDINNLERRLSEVTQRSSVAPDAGVVIPEAGTLAIRSCDFRDHEQRTLVAGKLDIPLGNTTLITGASGSGKSSLLRGLAGALGDQRCEIEVEGQMITLGELAQNVLYVAQSAGLFNQSIAYNISYPDVDRSKEELAKIVVAAGLAPVVASKMNGLDMQVGERGHNLSGGERQRVAIARALNSPRPIMLFDEATSSLDAVTEAFVLDNIMLKLKGRTIVFASHRVELFRKADHFLYVEDGAIVAAGTHEELMKLCPGYAEIWRTREEELSKR
ncbi:ABC transporter ATP-binding protein [Roseovarius sp. E0-M6]|uniref:ABC transporter ATP-binding protein n=1 Tax=Roseovarius sp. E0-M6 TaxID=3127118 RepID=UPI00300F8F2C